jgi:hypothetical protein
MDLVKSGGAQALLRTAMRKHGREKTCDQPRSNLIQLESLILAQSERWRQA